MTNTQPCLTFACAFVSDVPACRNKNGIMRRRFAFKGQEWFYDSETVSYSRGLGGCVYQNKQGSSYLIILAEHLQNKGVATGIDIDDH